MDKEIRRKAKEEKDRKKASKVNEILLEFLECYNNLNNKLRTQNQREIQKALFELYKQHEKYNNSMMNGPYNKSYQPYKTVQDLLSELEQVNIKDSKYLSILRMNSLYKDFLDTPVLINGEVSPVIKESFYLMSHSRVKQLLDICRENSHIPYSNELYTYIRMSLNKASMTLRELQKIMTRVKEIDTENILGCSAIDFYLTGGNGKPLFEEEEYQPEVARFCNHCNRLLQYNETKCKGHNVCSYYYEKDKPWYTEVLLNPDDMYDKIYTVPDEYYEFVTLPNLFEDDVFNILKESLPKDEYEVTLHPDIERLGDIKIYSKLTSRKYLIDCKNYNNPTNLKKYILDNNGMYIKSLINKDSTFLFTVPSHHMDASLLSYISRNRDLNKYSYILKNELNTVKYIIEEDSNYNMTFLGGADAE